MLNENYKEDLSKCLNESTEEDGGKNVKELKSWLSEKIADSKNDKSGTVSQFPLGEANGKQVAVLLKWEEDGEKSYVLSASLAEVGSSHMMEDWKMLSDSISLDGMSDSEVESAAAWLISEFGKLSEKSGLSESGNFSRSYFKLNAIAKNMEDVAKIAGKIADLASSAAADLGENGGSKEKIEKTKKQIVAQLIQLKGWISVSGNQLEEVTAEEE